MLIFHGYGTFWEGHERSVQDGASRSEFRVESLREAMFWPEKYWHPNLPTKRRQARQGPRILRCCAATQSGGGGERCGQVGGRFGVFTVLYISIGSKRGVLTSESGTVGCAYVYGMADQGLGESLGTGTCDGESLGRVTSGAEMLVWIGTGWKYWTVKGLIALQPSSACSATVHVPRYCSVELHTLVCAGLATRYLGRRLLLGREGM